MTDQLSATSLVRRMALALAVGRTMRLRRPVVSGERPEANGDDKPPNSRPIRAIVCSSSSDRGTFCGLEVGRRRRASPAGFSSSNQASSRTFGASEFHAHASAAPWISFRRALGSQRHLVSSRARATRTTNTDELLGRTNWHLSNLSEGNPLCPRPGRRSGARRRRHAMSHPRPPFGAGLRRGDCHQP